MRTRTAWLGLVVALCACGKAFDAGGASGGSGGGASGNPAVAGASPSGGSSAHGGGGATGSGGIGGTLGIGGLGIGGLGIGGLGMGDAGPPPIPTDGLALWLRADRGVVIKDGLVQQWLDQSDHGMDAIQTATNVQPKLVSNGLDNLPTLTFDGVGDFMKLPEGFSDFSKGLSIFVVLKPDDATCASVVELSNGSEIQDISVGMYQKIWQYELANEDVSGGTADAQPALLAALQHPSGAVELRLSGTLIGQGTFMAPDQMTRQQNFIGHTLYADCGYFQGEISEIVMYSRAVTDQELLTIEGYLRDHWSLKFPQ